MRWQVFLAASLLAALAASGCGRGEGKGSESDAEGVPVQVVTLEERSFPDVVTAPGEWQSGSELVIAAPTAGRLEALTVTVGDRVRAGQRVGTLVPRDSWAGLTGAQIMVGEARDAASKRDAQRALALARRYMVRVPLTVSQAGLVLRRSSEPGAEVAEAAEIVAVAPWNTVVFEAHVPVANATRVHTGESAIILDPNEAPRAGRVQRVLPMAADADQTTLVWLSPGSLTPSPVLERFGTASITVGPPRRSLAAPDSAVVEDDLTGEKRLAVVDAAGHLSWKAVTLGLAEGHWRAVSGPGLAPGMRIVTEGQRGLPAGTRVKPAS